MTNSLFEPSEPKPNAPKPRPLPPHTYRTEDRPSVWVQHEDGRWYEGILWTWTWDPQGGAYWGYVDFYAGRHYLRTLHQDQIRHYEDIPVR